MNQNTKLLLQLTFCAAILFLVYCLVTKNFFNTPVKEGVTFRHFDNSTFFTRPWDEFCVMPPPSWDGTKLMEKPAIIGIDPVGNWCKNAGEANSPPAVSPDCLKISNNHLYESMNLYPIQNELE